MDYMVIIPTYKRYNKVEPIAGLGLPMERYALCVNDMNEAREYRKFYPNVKIIIANVKGCTAARNYLLDHFPVGTQMVQVDDDVEGLFELRGTGKANLVKMTGREVDALIKDGFERCKRNKTNLWGVYPVHNHYFMSRTIVPHAHIVGMFMGIIVGPERFDPYLNSKVDYAFTIQNILRYRKILRYNYVSVKGKYVSNAGGLQTVRNADREEAEVLYLLNKYPKFVVRNTKREGSEILLKFRISK